MDDPNWILYWGKKTIKNIIRQLMTFERIVDYRNVMLNLLILLTVF